MEKHKAKEGIHKSFQTNGTKKKLFVRVVTKQTVDIIREDVL